MFWFKRLKWKQVQLYVIVTTLTYFSRCCSSQEGIVFPDSNEKPSRRLNGTSIILIHPSNQDTAERISNFDSVAKACDKRCIPLDLCPSLFALLEAPDTKNIRALQKKSCGFTPSGDPLVWCDEAICQDRSRKGSSSKSTTEAYPPTEGLVSASSEHSARRTHQSNVIALKHGFDGATTQTIRAIPPFENDELCGTAFPSRINGGQEAAREEFPWIIALAVQTHHGPQVICGGTLISEEWVVTAAHCVVDNFHRLRNISHVRVGAHDISNPREEGAENIRVKSILYHPQFRERPVIKNDIALLRLEKKVTFSVTVGTICLPSPDNTNNSPLSVESSGNMRTFIAGWGGNGRAPSFNILQKVEIPLIPSDTCKRALMRLRVRVSSDLQICGGARNRDSCKGDSGGPLMVSVRGRTTLIGIISYGTIQCDGSLPGVYTRVGSYMTWISETIFNATS